MANNSFIYLACLTKELDSDTVGRVPQTLTTFSHECIN